MLIDFKMLARGLTFYRTRKCLQDINTENCIVCNECGRFRTSICQYKPCGKPIILDKSQGVKKYHAKCAQLLQQDLSRERARKKKEESCLL